MSYILEALKKSKQERQSGDTPHLHVVHGAPSFNPRFSRFRKTLTLVVGLTVMLGVGGLAYLFLSEKDMPEMTGSSKSIHVRKIEILPQFIEGAEGDSVVVENSPYLSQTPVIEKESPQIIIIPKDKVKTVFIGSKENNKPSLSEEFLSLIDRAELPLNIQEELPQLVFAGHTYSDDPKQRMIIINNAILREGDSIDANTKLMTILWEGVVLEYKGILFKQKIR